MYSQHVTLSTFSLILLFLTATYLSKARNSLFVLKVLLNPNQSISLSSSFSFLVSSVTCLYDSLKITSNAALNSAALLYVVHHTVHCRNTMRNSQRYLLDVGEKTMTAIWTG